MRLPHEQTMLRVGHPMFSMRPQAGQHSQVPAGRAGATGFGGGRSLIALRPPRLAAAYAAVPHRSK